MNKGRETPVLIIVKRKGHAHPHHGGAWKVAFADFMTAMFALFLVLWLVNQSSDVKAAIAGYFQDPLGRANEFGSSIMKGEGAQTQVARPLSNTKIVDLRIDRLQLMQETIQNRLDSIPSLKTIAGHVEIAMTEEGLRIQLLEDSTGIFFQTGRAAPSEHGRELLALLGSELGKSSNDIMIEGHTDARPYTGGAEYSNWELSADRANTSRRIMVASGLSEHHVSQVRGMADRALRVKNDPYAPSNRRVSITVLFEKIPSDTVRADTTRFRVKRATP